ncbi:MAG: tripartite tricarboxylate transporter TctB family protein [Geminicoccaceae bacterium]|nr:tripartite tricarboxylate transporter TctB family protein [Geminicoccaceae bacterium]MCX8100160.1 tripartite tricarboxylate transporter TctB family protein [Geminicoccaceae bacterium]MDW8369274.1 tripartite tricarboxylate transporter TctB family protein [Geminicoccaceae bacterium]
MRIHDSLIGLVLLALAAFLAHEAAGFPPMPGQRFGPSLVPNLLAAGFALCGLVLVVAGIRRREVRGLVELGEWARKGGHILDVGLVVGGLALLIAFWRPVGFLLGATVYTTLLAARFRGGRWLSSLLVCAPACFAIDWAFRRLLLVPLPQGPLTGLYW